MNSSTAGTRIAVLDDYDGSIAQLPHLKHLAVTGLINTSRAEIIEKQALYAELASGRLSGAIDVFHKEPLHLSG
jgi:phosphoglycerate dehydrogenase-like enzyme